MTNNRKTVRSKQEALQCDKKQNIFKKKTKTAIQMVMNEKMFNCSRIQKFK